jgi:RES domain-containing protein
MVYTAESRSLAALEILTQIHGEPPEDAYVLIAAIFPAKALTRLDLAELPRNWTTYPPPPTLRILGDRWIANGTSLVLEVPSVVIPAERNFLINPQHPDFPSLQIAIPEPFTFDPRLFPRPLVTSPSVWAPFIGSSVSMVSEPLPSGSPSAR